MEVYLLAGLVVGLFILLFYLYDKNKNLRKEVESIGEVLRNEIKDGQRQIEDQRSTELELQIVKGKLEGFKESGLTPDNSVPKDIHLEKVLNLTSNLHDTQSKLQDMTEKFEKMRGKQKSQQVRLGQIGENFAAFHESFPYSRKDTKALFQPVDLICFEDDEIIFIDVKTGKAQLSSKQRKIRDNINSGRVRFEIHRLDENGYHIKE